jgi:hypothetical protein
VAIPADGIATNFDVDGDFQGIVGTIGFHGVSGYLTHPMLGAAIATAQ